MWEQKLLGSLVWSCNILVLVLLVHTDRWKDLIIPIIHRAKRVSKHLEFSKGDESSPVKFTVKLAPVKVVS